MKLKYLIVVGFKQYSYELLVFHNICRQYYEYFGCIISIDVVLSFLLIQIQQLMAHHMQACNRGYGINYLITLVVLEISQ